MSSNPKGLIQVVHLRSQIAVSKENSLVNKANLVHNFFFLLALQLPLGVVFYSLLVGFSLLACEVS